MSSEFPKFREFLHLLGQNRGQTSRWEYFRSNLCLRNFRCFANFRVFSFPLWKIDITVLIPDINFMRNSNSFPTDFLSHVCLQRGRKQPYLRYLVQSYKILFVNSKSFQILECGNRITRHTTRKVSTSDPTSIMFKYGLHYIKPCSRP